MLLNGDSDDLSRLQPIHRWHAVDEGHDVRNLPDVSGEKAGVRQAANEARPGIEAAPDAGRSAGGNGDAGDVAAGSAEAAGQVHWLEGKTEGQAFLESRSPETESAFPDPQRPLQAPRSSEASPNPRGNGAPMKFKSTILAQTSGSLDGTVFSHNRGGRYTRVRATPTNPNTPQQQAVRGFMSTLTNLWLSTLTQAERDAWDEYALQVPLLDRLGEPRNVGGIGMYCRSNIPRLQAGEPRVDPAPTIFDLGGFTGPGIISVTAATDTISLAFADTDLWANEDDSAMFIFTSRGQNASINFFKGPYRLAAVIQGDSITPPSSPADVVSPFALAVGQRSFIRVNVSRADGRLASDFRVFGTAV